MLPQVRQSELRDVLSSVAYALLGIYAVTVIAGALPPRLLEPAWIERVCGILRGGVSFPLIALVFLVMAQSPSVRDVEPKSRIRLRRLSSAVALGFILMVPLQTWAGVQGVRVSLREARRELLPISRGLERIRLAESEEVLLGAITTLPGAPPNLGGSLREPLGVVKQRLIAEIEPQLRARETRINELGRQRWKDGLVRWVKDAVVALFSAMGFFAIARSLKPQTNLLFAAYGGGEDVSPEELLEAQAGSGEPGSPGPAASSGGVPPRRTSVPPGPNIHQFFDSLHSPPDSPASDDRTS
ncbi:hypothetical protein [Synechococcus sp. CBW1004]|uniref:hypothetical protein n=1 Tax=Synechococcus sp. CBW1004 TaxID=1353136 RepID=UPI0018CD02FF|nr:hypothetical protein [Synechococcus sp. CBW1004]QPN62779.1 hypothetical protein H8F25_14130 [Synechococcus sp. CBW1004]